MAQEPARAYLDDIIRPCMALAGFGQRHEMAITKHRGITEWLPRY